MPMPDVIAIRASSLADLFDCPARWEAKHLRGLRLPSGPGAVLGHAVHAGAAAFDQAVINGEPISFDDAAGIVADAAREEARTVDVDWSGDMQPADVEKIGIDLCRLYCEQVSPEYDWAAVEASCEALVIEDVGLVLTGTTDRIYRDPILGYGIADIKTGKSSVAGRPAMPPSSACMSCWRPPATACASRPRPISSVCRRARPPKGSAPAPARWKTLVPGW